MGRKRSVLLLCLIVLCILCNAVGAKKKKKKTSHRPKAYNNVILYTYGSSSEDAMALLRENCAAFGWPRKSLGCSPLEISCTEQWMKKLDEIKSDSSYVVLFNHSSVLINSERVPMLNLLREHPTPLLIKKGQNGPMAIIDIQLAKTVLREHADKPINAIFELDSVKSAENPVFAREMPEDVFAQLDDSKHFVYEDGGLQTFIYEKTSDIRPVFVYDDILPDSFIPLSNILIRQVEAKKVVAEEKRPSLVHLVAVVDDPSLFTEEFFNKIYKIDYPKDSLTMAIVGRNKKKLELISQVKGEYFEKASIVESINEALKMGQNSTFTFLIRSTAHLEDKDVLKNLVAQDQNVMAPLLETYPDGSVPVYVNPFDRGWNITGTYTDPFLIMTVDRAILEPEKTENYLGLIRLQNFNVAPTAISYATFLKRWMDAFRKNRDDFELKSLNVNFFPSEEEFALLLDEHLKAKRENLTVFDHIERRILDLDKPGIYQALQLRDAYLIKTKILNDFAWEDSAKKHGVSEDTFFTSRLRKSGYVPKILADKRYGQIVNADKIPKSLKLHPELGRFYENHDLWQRRYIDPDLIKCFGTSNEKYQKIPLDAKELIRNTIKTTACPNVYYMKFFTPLFARDVLEEARQGHPEEFKKSEQLLPTSQQEPENFPQFLDLHKLGFERQWRQIMRYYILQRLFNAYQGFEELLGGRFHIMEEKANDPPMAYVEKELSYELKMFMALNEDYEGGGFKYLTQDCPIVPDPPIGHVLVAPNRLTHFARNMPVTKGTRYYLNMFSFVSYNKIVERRGLFVIPGALRKPEPSASEEEKREFLRAVGVIPDEED